MVWEFYALLAIWFCFGAMVAAIGIFIALRHEDRKTKEYERQLERHARYIWRDIK